MAFLTYKKKTSKAAEADTSTSPKTSATSTDDAVVPNTLEEIMIERCKNDSNFLHWFYPDEGIYCLRRKDKRETLEIQDVKAFSNWYSIGGVLYAKIRRNSTSKAGLIKYENETISEVLPSAFDNIAISLDGLLTAEIGGKTYEYPLKKEVEKGPVKVNSIADIISAASSTTP